MNYENLHKWKLESEEYVEELQKILDKIELIPDEKLKNEIRYHFLKCDEALAKLAENKFSKNKI